MGRDETAGDNTQEVEDEKVSDIDANNNHEDATLSLS